MKRKTFLTIVLILTCIMIFQIPLAASAAEQPLTSKPTTGVEADEYNKGEAHSSKDNMIGIMGLTDDLISRWGGSIEKASSSSVGVTAYTAPAGVANYSKIIFYIERWNGSSWVLYTSFSRVKYNTGYHFEAAEKSVASGYYYRLCATHFVQEMGDYEYQYTVTPYQYIG